MWFYIGYSAEDGTFQMTTAKYIGPLADGRVQYQTAQGDNVNLRQDQIVWIYSVTSNE